MPEEVIHTPETGTEQPNEPVQTLEQANETPETPAEPLAPSEDIDALKVKLEELDKKATAQGQENIVLNAKLKEYESRRDLTNDPTDSELQAAIPDWDLLEPWQKKVAKDSFIARRTSEVLLQEDQERKAQVKWNTDLEFVIAKNPSLLGKEQAFKEFASKPSRRGVEPDILVGAFLHQASAAPAPSSPTPRTPGLEPGTGGPKTPEKPKTLSGEELKKLRETDEKAYREYVSTHDLSNIAD